ncbi:MAG: DUF349 domain-containing protein [Gammaproteobacteria bacterium]|nr:DUF349 domain-containing protein [Gammaproteobacteria bacterium]
MLFPFFKGKTGLSQPDPTARRQAVEALPTAKADSLQDELLALAAGDDDPGVRKASIARLTSLEAVADLLDNPPSAEPAAQRIIDLLGPQLETTTSTLARHPLVLRLRVLDMPLASAEKVAAEITDLEQLIDLTIRARRELREAFLRHLQTAVALSELERQTRNHDKSLNRHARERLEQIRTTRHEAAQTHARINELAATLERHQRVDVDASAEQRRGALLTEFEQASSHYHELSEALRAIGEEPESISAASQQVQIVREQAPAEAPEPVADPFPDLAIEFRALQADMEEGLDFATATARRQALTEQWLSAADHSQPEHVEHQVFETVSHAYRELADSIARITPWSGTTLEPLAESFPEDQQQLHGLWRQVGQRRRALKQGQRLINDIAWPERVKPNAEYSDLLLGVNRLEQELGRAEAHEQQLVSRLETQIATLASEIEDGAFKTAFTTLNQARELSKSLPAGRVANLVKTLNHEAARLAELRDWQTFATTPKREALCESIQALVDKPFKPADQADRIKRLRSEWNELGPVSRSQDRKLAERFNALAEQAFEPCRTFFAEQAEVRKANLAERRKICDQLESYLDNTDWANADKKAAEQIMRTARSEWRRFHPVDRNPGRPLEARFEKLQDRLHELIKNEWETNLKLKQAIVDEAKGLLDGEVEVAERVDRAKALQRRWREIGITPRRPDQNLWREFRAACDAIFDARDEAKQQSQQADRDAVGAANALLGEWEAVLTDTAAADADEGVIREFRKRFAELPTLPERTERGLRNRFDEISRSYRVLLQSQAREAERARLDQLKAWDAQLGDEEARLRGASDSVELALPDPVFKPRLATLANEVPEDALRSLAVRVELLAGIESPESERELRLQIQVDRLNAGMGQQQTDPDPLELAREWCAAGPKHEGCSELRDRMFTALARIMED